MMSTVNQSSVALAERYAREHFNLSLPFTSDELKTAFRRKAKELHTDTSGDESTKEKFIAMKNAYDFLVKLEGMEFVYGTRGQSNGSVRFETSDGTPLYELGLGLGPMRNGRDCERCDHKGYTEVNDHFSYLDNEYCWKCDTRGCVLSSAVCHPCRGTGKFQQLRGRIVVTCRVCDGSGIKSNVYQICPDCHGSKRINKPQRKRFVKCYECKGTGEIELFNSVLPKGRMVDNKKVR